MRYIFTFVFSIFFICCFSQHTDSLAKNSKPGPLFYLDNIRVDKVILKDIKPRDIASVNLFKDLNANKSSGQAGKYAVVFFNTKNAVKKYWNFLRSKSDDYAEDFPTPFSDSSAQYILNDSLIKYPNITLQQLNDSNFQNIRVISQAELIRNYNINNKKFGVKIKAILPSKLPF
ncbi:hypothetical protein [Arachidicoccus soli]|uniref:Uncharacterized protein n=1 Tax=Arachidicoccus soli TaxID=2341117 RepID=A0A386HSF5_9BACT|nr:hypothetical protein [Arachidicoccus soli]AYD48589.1 hypothetical protein D6B99_13850 [Arachidicoccus soli]